MAVELVIEGEEAVEVAALGVQSNLDWPATSVARSRVARSVRRFFAASMKVGRL
jgi:hypothetical protein